tara:strand:- start:3370 stop:3990 length:621 start_codon:yes stop_codon:yes gene_type:complete
MKTIIKNLLLTVLGLFISASTYAQIEITPQAGYQIGSKYSYYDGYMKLKASGHYGVTVDFDINPTGAQVEVMYAYQNPDLNVKDFFYYPFETHIATFNIHHIQAGFIQNFNYDEDLTPFAGISGGITIFEPQDSLFESRTKFAFGLTGGVKYFFTERLGIRMQAQLLIPIEWGGVYYNGNGGAITTGGSLLQLNFTGGLIFRLGAS